MQPISSNGKFSKLGQLVEAYPWYSINLKTGTVTTYHFDYRPGFWKEQLVDLEQAHIMFQIASFPCLAAWVACLSVQVPSSSLWTGKSSHSYAFHSTWFRLCWLTLQIHSIIFTILKISSFDAGCCPHCPLQPLAAFNLHYIFTSSIATALNLHSI